MAHKVCTDEGTWFRHPQSNLTWSNYTTCVDVEDLEVSIFSAIFAHSIPCFLINSRISTGNSKLLLASSMANY